MAVSTVPCLLALIFCVSFALANPIVTKAIDFDEDDAAQMVEDLNELEEAVRRDVPDELILTDDVVDDDDSSAVKRDPIEGSITPSWSLQDGLAVSGKLSHDFDNGLKASAGGHANQQGDWGVSGKLSHVFDNGLKVSAGGHANHLGDFGISGKVSHKLGNGFEVSAGGQVSKHGDWKVSGDVSRKFGNGWEVSAGGHASQHGGHGANLLATYSFG